MTSTRDPTASAGWCWPPSSALRVLCSLREDVLLVSGERSVQVVVITDLQPQILRLPAT